MGLLNLFSKQAPKLMGLPSGSFTVDPDGRILVSTLPQTFPAEMLNDIATQVLAAFKSSREIQLQFSELVIRYGSLKLTARELGGGALIFLAPQTMTSANS